MRDCGRELSGVVAEDGDGFLYRDTRNDEPKDDVEAPKDIQPSRTAASSATDFEGSIVSTLTPYFHFDLSSAVKAAEKDAALADAGSPGRGDSPSLKKGELEEY